MDETEIEKAKEAAALLGRLGGRIRAETPGEMSRIGRISARKRALSPETLGKMGRKGGAARAAAYSPEQRSEMSRKAYATRREREEAKKQAASPLLVGTEVSAKPE